MDKVYSGLDAGSRTCHVVAMDEAGVVLTNTRFSTGEANLIATLGSIPGEVHVHLEAGELAGWIRGVLHGRVARVVVSHAQTNAWIAKDPHKGARVDAFKLAELLRLGRVHEVYYPDPDDDHRRVFKQLVQHYDDVTDQQVRLKQKIKARLRVEGIICQGQAVYTPTPNGRQAALNRVGSVAKRQMIEQLYTLLDQTLETQQDAKQLMAREARHCPEIARFREVPGVGLIGACWFSAYVQNPHRFSSKRKLWRYCRLAITDRTSDGKPLGHKRLDRSGHGRLKQVSRQAFQAAMRCKEDNAFKRGYRRTLERTQNATHARLTTQRKILAVLYAMWNSGPSRPRVDPDVPMSPCAESSVRTGELGKSPQLSWCRGPRQGPRAPQAG